MATIVLGLAGAAIGGSIFGPIAGAIIGRAVGAIAGRIIDQAIISALTPPIEQHGPRLTSTDIQTSTEGAPVDRIYGRARVTGQVIWATEFEEVVTTETHGGKGFGGPEVRTTTYSYFGNFAIGLCSGPVAGIGRVWADGEEIDRTKYELRFHPGSETQEPDPLIEAAEGEAPAYRGLAYIVFERLPLEKWGNRLPQIGVEIFAPVGALEKTATGVAVISGNEFGFDPTRVDAGAGGFGGLLNGLGLTLGPKTPENRHNLIAASDWTASIDRLQMLMPNLTSVMLVVPWFGDDLRAGDCTIRPKVDSAEKATAPVTWLVSGLDRDNALVVSQVDGKAAFGGTPADASLIRAIQNLNARGLAVTLLPFIMMDIEAGNTLPDPYSDNAAGVGQDAYPWRGRITGSPAAGFAGTVDKTATAATQVAAFTGTADPGDFGGSGSTVTYSGPDEWTYRRFILHNAKLAAIAGGVDTFLIGSEMVGLTQLRSSATAYPFVEALVTLAGDCRAILGGSVEIGYAADWSEYHSHRPADGSNDVFFNLDPLWSDGDIDFVGIDNYLPVADWRDGSAHLDFDPAGPVTVYDRDYLQANVEGGEYFDWYYADAAARDSQTRTPIVDSAEGKHWVFRQKDIQGWWANAHNDRPGGTESETPTGWTAEGKPVRFIEFGCPAVDKGANQPNVFVDPKSAESAWPHYSNHARDDAMQRAFLEAVTLYWLDAANNPVSSVYAGPMVDIAGSHIWAWDARPWPSFPQDTSWGDWANWETGHWISGRFGSAPAADTIAAIVEASGFSDHSIEPIPFGADGVTTGTLASPRSMLAALQPAFQFDAVESDGVIKFLARLGRASLMTVGSADLVADPENPVRFRQTRAQETELPEAVKMRFGDSGRDDQPGAVEARRSAGASRRLVDHALPALLAENAAAAIAERELHGAWAGRERVSFALPPRFLALDPGDAVTFSPTSMTARISDIGDAHARSIDAFAVDPLAFGPVALPLTGGPAAAAPVSLDAVAVFVDGPLLDDGHADHAGYVAAAQLPFGAGVALWRSPSDSGFVLDSVLDLAGKLAVTTEDFASGPTAVWDRANTLSVELLSGTLSSADELLVLNGANAALVENADGEWELLQFSAATLTGARTYDLTGLLRGRKGTEHAMREPVAAGARVVFIDEAVRQTGLPAELAGLQLNWRAGPAGAAIGEEGFTSYALTIEGKGRRPLSPVHAAGAIVAGDAVITWIRRTRIGGDSWEQVEVPLGEASEAWEIDVLDAMEAVVRTIGAAIPTATYTAAEMSADGISAPFDVVIYQLSATFGRGIGTRITIDG